MGKVGFVFQKNICGEGWIGNEGIRIYIFPLMKEIKLNEYTKE